MWLWCYASSSVVLLEVHFCDKQCGKIWFNPLETHAKECYHGLSQFSVVNHIAHELSNHRVYVFFEEHFVWFYLMATSLGGFVDGILLFLVISSRTLLFCFVEVSSRLMGRHFFCCIYLWNFSLSSWFILDFLSGSKL